MKNTKRLFFPLITLLTIISATTIAHAYSGNLLVSTLCDTIDKDDYPRYYQRCNQYAHSPYYFDQNAIGECKSNLISSSPMDRVACLEKIVNQSFDVGAVQICQNVMQFEYTDLGFQCLQSIANKIYSPDDLQACAFQQTGMTYHDVLQKPVTCLATKGQRSAAPIIIIEQ